MINFIQLNQNITKWDSNIITNDVWENIIKLLIEEKCVKLILDYINKISIQYNMDKKNILKGFLNYIIRNKSEIVNNNFLDITEVIMHSNDSNIDRTLKYFISSMKTIYTN
jgi:hypothetical protein